MDGDRYKIAYEAWYDYYERTEAFDRTLEGAWTPRGGWLPFPRNMGASTRNADRVRAETLRYLAEHGITEADADGARHKALRDHDEKLRVEHQRRRVECHESTRAGS